jgi:hypothetical protein
MANLTIKSEYYPDRCEICHCADLFDQQTGICSRCSEVESVIFFDPRQKAGAPRFKITAESDTRWRELARRYPRLFSGLWFGVAGSIPAIMMIVIEFFVRASEPYPEHALILVAVPVSIAFMFGSVYGSGILNNRKITTSRKATLRGMMVALLSFLFYISFLVIGDLRINLETVWVKEIDRIIEFFLMYLVVGSRLRGWFALLVGGFAGRRLYRFRQFKKS